MAVAVVRVVVAMVAVMVAVMGTIAVSVSRREGDRTEQLAPHAR